MKDIAAERFALACIAIPRAYRSVQVAKARCRVKRRLARAGVYVDSEATYPELVAAIRRIR